MTLAPPSGLVAPSPPVVMRVRDVMISAVVTLAPHDPLATALSRLRAAKVSGCPVLSQQGEVLGVLSERDIATALGEDLVRSRPQAIMDLVVGEFPWSQPDAIRELRSRLNDLQVEQAMTRPAEVVEADAPLAEAAWRMRQRGVNRLPVVDHGRLVGIIARRDLVGAWPGMAPPPQTDKF
jgi:CBS domain-containing protein